MPKVHKVIPSKLFTHSGLLFILIILFFQPLFAQLAFGKFIFDLLLSVLFIGGVYANRGARGQHRLALSLAIAALISRAAEDIFNRSAEAALFANFFAALFFSYVAWLILDRKSVV